MRPGLQDRLDARPPLSRDSVQERPRNDQINTTKMVETCKSRGLSINDDYPVQSDEAERNTHCTRTSAQASAKLLKIKRRSSCGSAHGNDMRRRSFHPSDSKRPRLLPSDGSPRTGHENAACTSRQATLCGSRAGDRAQKRGPRLGEPRSFTPARDHRELCMHDQWPCLLLGCVLRLAFTRLGGECACSRWSPVQRKNDISLGVERRSG